MRDARDVTGDRQSVQPVTLHCHFESVDLSDDELGWWIVVALDYNARTTDT